MRFRKLRIAWSVAWGVVAVLLCVLWVRSYWRIDSYSADRRGYHSYFQVMTGEFRCLQFSGVGWMPVTSGRFNTPISGYKYHENRRRQESERRALGFGYSMFGNGWEIAVPLWFPTMISAVVIPVPWIGWSKRFSLCTLLLATTLIAVGLGLIVWMSRAG